MKLIIQSSVSMWLMFLLCDKQMVFLRKDKVVILLYVCGNAYPWLKYAKDFGENSEATDSKDCVVFAFECVVLKAETLTVHC